MKYNHILIFSLSLLIVTYGCGRRGSKHPADLVLLHGKILTMDSTRPQGEALAVRGNTIFSVGSNNEIEPLIGANTKVIDLKGFLAVPGLIDGHGHFMSLGESLMGIDLRPARTWDEIVNQIAEAVR